MTNYRTVKHLFILLFIVISINTFSQGKDCFVKLRGLTEDNMRPAEDVTIRLYQGQTLVKEMVTDFTGKFDFKLDTGNYYIVEMEKPGYIKKKLAFDTRVPKNETGVWVNDFAFNLVKECSGVDISLLEKPMDEIKFDLRSRGFKPDNDYNRKIFKDLQNIYYDLDQCLMDKYKETLKKADELYKQDKLNEARLLYMDASEQMPDDQYPRKKMYDVVQELQKRYANEANYVEIKNEADKLFAEKKYDEALALYEQAKQINKNDPGLNTRINQANQMVLKENEKKNNARIEADKIIRQENDNFNNLVTQGDNLLKNKDYINSKTAYEQALALKPNDPYLKTQLNKVDKLILKDQQDKQLAEQTKKEEQYRNLINEGNNMLTANNFDLAKQKFEEALLLKPGDIVAQGKINEVNRQVNLKQQNELSQKENEQKYNQYIQDGENLIKIGKYNDAKQKFELAKNIKPNDVIAQNKINQVNQILEQQNRELAQKEKDQKYNQYIQEGNNLMNLGEYSAAKDKFDLAKNLKPTDQVVHNKLNQIDRLIEQQRLANIEKKQKDEQYNKFIQEGTNLLTQGDLDGAKQKFELAKNINPADALVLNKLNDVNTKIELKKLADINKQNELKKENDYKTNITNADQLLAKGDYQQAKQMYETALTLKPGDTYARNKLDQTNTVIQKQKQEELNSIQKDNQFNLAIQKANNLYQQGDLTGAKSEFQNALNIKPGDAVALSRVKEIDQQILSKQQREQQAVQQENTFKQSVAKGDDLMKKNDFQNALLAYNDALKIKPTDTYVTNKIEELEGIIAKKQAEVDRKIAYDNALDLADKYFSKSDYRNAREQYEKALLINPGSVHAKGQLDKINKMTNTTTQTDNTVVPTALPDLKFNTDNERKQYLAILSRKYPAGITLEIYKEKYKTTYRYVVIRNNEANEFREIRHSWGGVDYSINDRPITSLYFKQQTKQREGEYFKEFEK